MRVIVASDIHGSAYYAEKLRKRIEIEKPDFVILLGDLLYHGPRNSFPKDYNPAEVANILNKIEIPIRAVKGNCDSEVDQCLLNFPIMAEYAIFFIDGRTYFATHGDKFNKDNLPLLSNGDILINGHFHVPEISKIGKNNFYINPGSISIPKNNSTNSYMIIENNSILIESLDESEKVLIEKYI